MLHVNSLLNAIRSASSRVWGAERDLLNSSERLGYRHDIVFVQNMVSFLSRKNYDINFINCSSEHLFRSPVNVGFELIGLLKWNL